MNANLKIKESMRLKEQLRFYIELHGINASTLARHCRVPKTCIADWLAGTSPRKIEHLKEVAQYFKVTIDHLCFGNGNHRDLESPFPENESPKQKWLSGVFEVRFRRVRSPKTFNRRLK